MLQHLTVTAPCICGQKLQCMWLQHTLAYSKPGTTATPASECYKQRRRLLHTLIWWQHTLMCHQQKLMWLPHTLLCSKSANSEALIPRCCTCLISTCMWRAYWCEGGPGRTGRLSSSLAAPAEPAQPLATHLGVQTGQGRQADSHSISLHPPGQHVQVRSAHARAAHLSVQVGQSREARLQHVPRGALLLHLAPAALELLIQIAPCTAQTPCRLSCGSTHWADMVQRLRQDRRDHPVQGTAIACWLKDTSCMYAGDLALTTLRLCIQISPCHDHAVGPSLLKAHVQGCPCRERH